jgi:hypothetical protein
MPSPYLHKKSGDTQMYRRFLFALITAHALLVLKEPIPALPFIFTVPSDNY